MRITKLHINKILSLFLVLVMMIGMLPVNALTALAAETYDITDAYGTVLIEGSVLWDDEENQDSFRPDSVNVSLYANVNSERVLVDTQTVTGPQWKYAFDISNGIPDGNGGYITPIGATFTVSQPAINRYNVTNIVHPIVEFQDPSITGGWEKTTSCSSLDITHEGVDGLSIVASKMTSSGTVVIWSEQALAPFEREIVIDSLEKNANGLGNPKNYVFLSGEGASSEHGITVTSTNILFNNTSDWSIFFVGMYNKGASNVSASSITNTYIPETITLQTKKIWNDDNNRDGIRPTSVQFRLYKNGVAFGDPVTVDATTSWTHQFTDLDKYDGGNLIVYTIAEVGTVPGYTSSAPVVDPDTGVISITNSRPVEKVDISVKKEWNDNNNQDGKRPNSVQVTLYANGIRLTSEGTTVTLNEGNNWSYTWSDLYAYYRGSKINYTVREEVVPTDYQVSYAKENNVCTITNTHIPEKIDIPVTKVWEDGDNQDGMRPAQIVVELYKGSTKLREITLKVEENWTGVFTGLNKYENGAEIAYTVKEKAVTEGYTADVSGDTNGYIVTNSHTPEVISISAVKRWVGGTPDNNLSVTLHLLADGQHTGQTAEVNAANDWKATWTNLPQYKNGTKISYTVTEDVTDIPKGYYVQYSMDPDGTRVIINTYNPDKTAITVEKLWDDDNDRDKVRPASVTVKLLANGSVVNTLTLNSEGRWIGFFTDLPITDRNGAPITYTVEEDRVDGYEAPVYTTDAHSGNLEITNKRVPEKTSVSAKKVWDDDNNRDNLRLDEVTLVLYADGNKVEDSEKVANKENGWTVSWTDLDKNSNGTPVVYTVREEVVPRGYQVSYAKEGNDCTITNTHIPEKIDIPVTKVWEDNNNQDGKRPAEIVIELYKGSTKLDEIMLGKDNYWSGEFTELYKYENGAVINYSVKEKTIPAGYTAADPVFDGQTGGWSITNTHIPEKTSITANKVWNDDNNRDGLRPDSIIVHIEKNGEHMGESYKKVLSAATGWTATWDDLPKYTLGVENEYHVYEEPVTGYDVGYARDPQDRTKITITNTHIPEKVSVPVVKVWNDGNNRDGLRPTEIVVQLYADGVPVAGKTITLNEANLWMGIWNDLNKNKNGTAITYTAEEITVVSGYTAHAEIGVNGVHRIINTHDPKTTSFTVTKVWADANNRDGFRPTGVIVQLYANDIAVPGAVVELNEANNWTHTWDQAFGGPMYVYRNGVKIVYTVQEIGYMQNGSEVEGIPTGYTVSYAPDGDYKSTIVNTHLPERVSVTVEKKWNDEDNKDSIRPEGIKVVLYKGVEVISEEVTLNEANGWKYTWTDLYKYSDGIENVYTVQELPVEGYDTEYSTGAGQSASEIVLTIENIHLPERVSVTVEKKWNDDNNKDSIRPEGIKVVLYKGTEAISEEVTLNEANGWKYTWTDLYKYSDGIENVYTVQELPVEGYEVEYITGTGQSASEILLTIENTQVTKFDVLTISKLWNDQNNVSKLRPQTVSIQLYKNGTAYGDVIVLSEENQWKFEIKVVTFENGQDVVWTIQEINVPDGYEATYDQATLTVTNKHTPVVPEIPDNPKTGDNSHLGLMFALLVTSGCGLITMLFFVPRKKGKYQR